MHEDKLTQDQRLRLECLAQAIVATGAAAGRPTSTEVIISAAKDFEKFLRGATGE